MMENTKEKPSTLSKRVVKTHLHNEWENVTLESKLKSINKQKYNQNYVRIETVQKLQKIMIDIKKVKTKMSVGPERRRFLLKHGYAIQVKDFEVSYFLELIDGVTSQSKDRSYNYEMGGALRSHTPLLRLSDFKRHKEIMECRQKIDCLTENREKTDAQTKIDSHSPLMKKRSSLQKIRKIEPPLKGREMWKVHLDKNKLEFYQNNSEESVVTTNEFQTKVKDPVEEYRQKIIGKLKIGTSTSFVKKQRKQRPVTTPSLTTTKVTQSNRPVKSALPDTHKHPQIDIMVEDVNQIESNVDNMHCSNTRSQSSITKNTTSGLLIHDGLNVDNSKYLRRRSHSTSRLLNVSNSKHIVNKKRVKSARIREQNEGKITELQITIQGRCAKVFLPKF